MAASLFDSLTPEQLAALMQGSTLQGEGDLLAQQLAEIMGPQEHREYSTPIGAGLGGIAEAFDGTANAFHAKALRGDQKKNLDAQGKLKGDFAALLRSPAVDPGAEFALPEAALRNPINDPDLSAPPMLEANPDIPAGGVMPMGIDLSGGVPTSAQPITAATDITQFPEFANLHLPQLKKKRGAIFGF